MITYAKRSTLCTNPTAKVLLNVIEKKRTNLAVSLDVTTSQELLKLSDILGPAICVLKTHIDIIEDFSFKTIAGLEELSKKHNFLIFEDRKFADIGNTVKLQYEKGIYRISDWAKITNAHSVPGPGVISGLKEVGLPKGNGLLLLAEMSSKGNLAKGDYTQKTVEMAKANKDFVIGFITQRKLVDDPVFINLTPGVKLNEGGDNLGQQYITPYQAIAEQESDIIIVGRGIYEVENPLKEAEKYRKASWDAYQHRTAHH